MNGNDEGYYTTVLFLVRLSGVREKSGICFNGVIQNKRWLTNVPQWFTVFQQQKIDKSHKCFRLPVFVVDVVFGVLQFFPFIIFVVLWFVWSFTHEMTVGVCVCVFFCHFSRCEFIRLVFISCRMSWNNSHTQANRVKKKKVSTIDHLSCPLTRYPSIISSQRTTTHIPRVQKQPYEHTPRKPQIAQKKNRNSLEMFVIQRNVNFANVSY